MTFPHLLTKAFSTIPKIKATAYSKDFTLWRDFFSPSEQHILLTASLKKLDSAETRHFRRRKKACEPFRSPQAPEQRSVRDLFLLDEYYNFHEGHYDGVIHHFREIHLTSWLGTDVMGLMPVLNRLHSLCPTQNIQTHLLHLGSKGQILPHVDNISASGSWILGVSLGAERILRMECESGGDDNFEVILASGSVYLQRDTMRFDYKHSISRLPPASNCDESQGQRLSIIIRETLPTVSQPT